MRAGLRAGEITFGDVVSIMPLNNTIVAVEVPDRVVREVLASGGSPVVAGLRETLEGLMLIGSGELIRYDFRCTDILLAMKLDWSEMLVCLTCRRNRSRKHISNFSAIH